MGNINFEVPENLHKSFKIISVKESKDMKDILVDLIAMYVNDYESKEGDKECLKPMP